MASVWLEVDGRNYKFQLVKVKIKNQTYSDLFSLKNNKTLFETIQDKKYRKLAADTGKRYSNYMNWRIGDFLLEQKYNDVFYKRFLNSSGDLNYCHFTMEEPRLSKLRGLYAFKAEAEVKYIGRCLDTFSRRINQGYGRIDPKNCFIDGQPVNCRINNLVLSHISSFELFLLPHPGNPSEISDLEKKLIAKYKPEWNKQHKQGY